MTLRRVQGDFIEVLPEHVRVAANRAEWSEDIDIERAKADLRRDVLLTHRHLQKQETAVVAAVYEVYSFRISAEKTKPPWLRRFDWMRKDAQTISGAKTINRADGSGVGNAYNRAPVSGFPTASKKSSEGRMTV